VLIADDIVQVRSRSVQFYVLRGSTGLCLIDGGFVGGVEAMWRELDRVGWSEWPIEAVLLTHGHLDHALNLKRLQQEFGAWIAAPRADAAHIQGTYRYQGLARICGALEWAGRALLHYEPCQPHHWLVEGDEFPVLGGLRAVALPGHTAGHTGFYSPSRKLFFTGDLFADFRCCPRLPPRILNTSPSELRRSVARVLEMDLDGILPNHGRPSTPEGHLERLRTLAARLGIGVAT